MKEMESQQKHEVEFRRALEAFEACVETPFVPGELEQWINAVAAALAQFKPLLFEHSSRVHLEEFEQIAAHDPELLRRVEQMCIGDRTIAEDLTGLEARVERLIPLVAAVEPDEAALAEMLDQLVADALALVLRVRKQEVSVRTWLIEAYDRDRGAVD